MEQVHGVFLNHLLSRGLVHDEASRRDLDALGHPAGSHHQLVCYNQNFLLLTVGWTIIFRHVLRMGTQHPIIYGVRIDRYS
jgi:hypothetical protein